MARADLVTSLVLLALGLATVLESWRMPRFTEFGASPYSAPGLVPGMLGAALLLLGMILCGRSVLAGRHAAGEPASAEGGWSRVLIAFVLCFLYAAILVGQVPFWLATFLFVLAFILIFEFWNAGWSYGRLRRTLMALGVAAVTALAVSYVFQEIFFVRLP